MLPAVWLLATRKLFNQHSLAAFGEIWANPSFVKTGFRIALVCMDPSGEFTWHFVREPSPTLGIGPLIVERVTGSKDFHLPCLLVLVDFQFAVFAIAVVKTRKTQRF